MRPRLASARLPGGVAVAGPPPRPEQRQPEQGLEPGSMMKFKPNQQEDEVLLGSSSRHPDQWIVPGGGMEPEEEQAALL